MEISKGEGRDMLWKVVDEGKESWEKEEKGRGMFTVQKQVGGGLG